ncbi:MAG: PEP-CTERM sorting domain-containing protein [Pseudomonadota bacterium]|nr:PEP-CTERM sorting domain-containing protein [Pseudomonadota bacterium]
MKSTRLLSALSLAAGMFAVLPAAHAVTFTELGDAGQSVASAQNTAGSAGSLTNIFGSLASTSDADLYLINITDAAGFSANTVNAVTGDLDTMLFLFTMGGAPVYLNDDAPIGTTVGSQLQAGNAFGPLVAGTYVLGVSFSGVEPVNAVNQYLFANGTLNTDTRGPAFGLQPAVLSGFEGDGFGPPGAYDIQLTGVGAVPEPATSLMLLAGAFGVLGATRRARRARLGA